MRQQSTTDTGFQYEPRRTEDGHPREALTHLQNANLMDLQMATNTKYHSFKPRKTNSNFDSGKKQQHLDVKLSTDSTVTFQADEHTKHSPYDVDLQQFPPNGAMKPAKRKKAEKAMQVQIRMEQEYHNHYNYPAEPVRRHDDQPHYRDLNGFSI